MTDSAQKLFLRIEKGLEIESVGPMIEQTYIERSKEVCKPEERIQQGSKSQFDSVK
jgi:hypothetical protein